MMHDVLNKIKRKWMKMRLQPIRMFCFHQVSEQLNPAVHCKPDWMSISEFKQKIHDLRKEGYVFISLQEAHRHLTVDWIRCKKYAVLTCDDGLKCQAELIPWLEEEKIPMTMFVTAKYLDGKSCGPQLLNYFGIDDMENERTLAEQLYLNEEVLKKIDSPMVSIGMHGYEHINARLLEESVFGKQLDKCRNILQCHKRFIPFYAYPYGAYTKQTDNVLKSCGIVPVYIDYQNNYNDATCIHRELL